MTRFAYTAQDDRYPVLMPVLSLMLRNLNRSITVTGLVDSGAALNVLPYDAGVALGFRWENQRPLGRLSGNLFDAEARAVTVAASHPQLTRDEPVDLVFGWSEPRPYTPVIFGQMNFFLEFDICFYRANAVFEVTRRTLD